MPFTVSSRLAEGTLVLSLTGDLTGDSESEAVLRLASQQIAAGVTRCVADLGGVRFLNSGGLSVLIGLLTRFRNAGGELILAAASPDLRKLLVITRLESIFTIAPNLPAAEQRVHETA